MSVTRRAALAAMLVAGMLGSSRAARLEADPASRRLALVVRLDASAGRAPEHVSDASASPGLVVGLVGAPMIDGPRCTLRFVITNLTERVAYNPQVRLERANARGVVTLLTLPLIEGPRGLGGVAISDPVQATVDLASLDDAGGTLRAIPVSSPSFLGSIGSHGAGPGAFSKPRGLAIDPRGRLIVADRGNNRVQVVSDEGKALQAWGSLGTGPEQFDHPEDVEIDARTGRIFVCDMNNARIHVLSAQGKLVANWPTDGTLLNHPSDIAVAPNGECLYVADSGNARIIKLDAQGRRSGGWGEFGEGAAQFRAILDVETDAEGRVYVTDGSNATVQVFTSEGRLVASIGRGGPGGDRVRYPTAVVALPGDRLLVSDFADDRVMAFRLDGTFLGEFGRAGRGQGDFQYPNDMVVHGSRLFVSQTASDTITIFDLAGWAPFEMRMEEKR